jgi:hypothetical protein
MAYDFLNRYFKSEAKCNKDSYYSVLSCALTAYMEDMEAAERFEFQNDFLFHIKEAVKEHKNTPQAITASSVTLIEPGKRYVITTRALRKVIESENAKLENNTKISKKQDIDNKDDEPTIAEPVEEVSLSLMEFINEDDMGGADAPDFDGESLFVELSDKELSEMVFSSVVSANSEERIISMDEKQSLEEQLGDGEALANDNLNSSSSNDDREAVMNEETTARSPSEEHSGDMTTESGLTRQNHPKISIGRKRAPQKEIQSFDVDDDDMADSFVIGKRAYKNKDNS